MATAVGALARSVCRFAPRKLYLRHTLPLISSRYEVKIFILVYASKLFFIVEEIFGLY